MDLGLGGKVAWVLGASAGLGRAVAESLAREGASVAISARRPAALEAAANDITSLGGRCIAVPTDVTRAASLEEAHGRVVAELGPVDIAVSNSGGPPTGTFDDLSPADLLGAYRLLLESAWHVAALVTPRMKETRNGCLVFVTSGSVKEPIPGLLLSNAVRPGVVGLAKTLSTELGPHGVRVVSVAPGRHDTDRVATVDGATAARTGKTIDEVRAESARRIPLGRYGGPREFGDVVAFLASERASYVTGVTIAVDGGGLHGLLS